MTRVLSFPIPKDLKTGTYMIRLIWKELNGFVPPEVTARLDLKALPRPSLLASLRVIDDGSGQSTGNGDGIIQRGEAVDLVLAVKNAGEAEARGTTVKLTMPDHPGLQLFGEHEVSLGNLGVGAVKEGRFNVAVKRISDLQELPVQLEVREQSFSLSKVIKERLPFEARITRPVEALAPREVFVRAERADLLSGADLKASPVGYAPRGAALRATGRSGDFYRVEIEGGRRAWVVVADVSEAPVKVASGAPSAAPPARVVLESFPPPSVLLTSPAPGTVTEREQVEVIGGVLAVGNSMVTDVQILVNGAAVKESGGHDIGIGAKGKKRVDLRQVIALRPGENRIEVVARDDRGLTSRESLTVRREVSRGQMAAVVIGIDRYRSVPPLRYAAADAQSFYDYLVGELGVPKERVLLLLNEEATLRNLKSALGTWLPRISGPQDTVLIFYAGHGAPEEDSSSPDGDSLTKYLLPVEVQTEDLYGTAFGMEEVQGVFSRVRARRLLFLADACFSGAMGGRTIARPLKSRDVAVSGKFLERLAQGEGRVILTASGPNELSREEPKLGHGVFTYYLLQGLRGAADADRNGYVTLPEAFEYVSREVAQATGQKQRPVLKGELSGEIVLGQSRTGR